MKRVQRTALLPYPAQAMFDLVRDVARYSQFLPGCVASELLEESPQEALARLTIKAAGFHHSFTTRNRLRRPPAADRGGEVTGQEARRREAARRADADGEAMSIEVSLVEGPFKALEGCWRFTQLGEDGCRVGLELQLEAKGWLAGKALEGLADEAADRMVAAFCARAGELFGA